MKIKRVKWLNHPVLGNLELDFTNAHTGRPYNTVLFAGENGTGKTSILSTMSTFLNIGSFQPFDYFEYEIGGQLFRATQNTGGSGIHNFFQLQQPDGSTRVVNSDRNNRFSTIAGDTNDIRSYGCVFSKARADYKTREIKSTTTKALDIDKYDVDEEDDFTTLKQLIVDVDTQDATQYAETNKVRDTNPISWADFFPTSKIFRFKNSFDSFFDTIKYDKVSDVNNLKSIIFTKNGRSIAIDDLSTGEKQIVFRGIYLLKNSRNLNGASVMIDEPELSMHPKWQRNILKYYKNLFTPHGTAIQTTQMFFATHSEHVLEKALESRADNLVIVLWDDHGVIRSKRIDAPSVLPSITAAETNYLAFDIVSNDYHIELYGWLQEREGLTTVKSCDDYIIAHAPPYNSAIHAKTSSHGTTTYNSLSTFIRNAIHHPDAARTFTEDELRRSIELLIGLLR